LLSKFFGEPKLARGSFAPRHLNRYAASLKQKQGKLRIAETEEEDGARRVVPINVRHINSFERSANSFPLCIPLPTFR
jgi:hypothetical protein